MVRWTTLVSGNLRGGREIYTHSKCEAWEELEETRDALAGFKYDIGAIAYANNINTIPDIMSEIMNKKKALQWYPKPVPFSTCSLSLH